MLVMTGLALNGLELHIKKTNYHLLTNSQLHVSLHNGPQAFVVTGPARALLNLVTGPEWVRPEQDAVLAEEALKLWTVELTNMVNLLRILGAVKAKKASHHFVTRPTQVIVPTTVSSITMASTSSQKYRSRHYSIAVVQKAWVSLFASRCHRVNCFSYILSC